MIATSNVTVGLDDEGSWRGKWMAGKVDSGRGCNSFGKDICSQFTSLKVITKQYHSSCMYSRGNNETSKRLLST